MSPRITIAGLSVSRFVPPDKRALMVCKSMMFFIYPAIFLWEALILFVSYLAITDHLSGKNPIEFGLYTFIALMSLMAVFGIVFLFLAKRVARYIREQYTENVGTEPGQRHGNALRKSTP